MMGKPTALVAGNWKMNGLNADLEEAQKMAVGLPGLDASCKVMLCPSFTLIESMVQALESSSIAVGAQDCAVETSGAHTGDVSAEMLADAGASAIIVGHSERRADHGETDAIVAAKAQAAWRAGLKAIICIGETQAQRDAGSTLEVVGGQLAGSIPEGATAENTIVAYEPVWAIGTGLTPTPDDVAQVHAFIRGQVIAKMGNEGAGVRLLYGGSVKASNAVELMGVENVDGALVGGASLKADDFLGIIRAYA